jgi:hypothetical protein
MFEHISYLWRKCRYCNRHRFVCIYSPCEERVAKCLHVFGDGRKWTGKEQPVITDTLGRRWEFVSTNTDIETVPRDTFDDCRGAIGDHVNVATAPSAKYPGLGNVVYKRVA